MPRVVGAAGGRRAFHGFVRHVITPSMKVN